MHPSEMELKSPPVIEELLQCYCKKEIGLKSVKKNSVLFVVCSQNSTSGNW